MSCNSYADEDALPTLGPGSLGSIRSAPRCRRSPHVAGGFAAPGRPRLGRPPTSCRRRRTAASLGAVRAGVWVTTQPRVASTTKDAARRNIAIHGRCRNTYLLLPARSRAYAGPAVAAAPVGSHLRGVGRLEADTMSQSWALAPPSNTTPVQLRLLSDWKVKSNLIHSRRRRRARLVYRSRPTRGVEQWAVADLAAIGLQRGNARGRTGVSAKGDLKRFQGRRDLPTLRDASACRAAGHLGGTS